MIALFLRVCPHRASGQFALPRWESNPRPLVVMIGNDFDIREMIWALDS
jgi:hypothetical protein